MGKMRTCLALVWVSVIFSAAAAAAIAGRTGVDVLPPEMMNEVRGAAPACTANHSYFPCSEIGTVLPPTIAPRATCWQKDQANCSGSCIGCDSSGQNDQCSAAKPWNSLCDPSKSSNVAGGCGSWFDTTTSTCMWNATAQSCRCSGTPPVNASACPQWKIVDNPTTCTIVP
jgi:hypothetical protein